MRAPLPLEVLHAIRPSTWHALFASRGYPSGITPGTDSVATIAAVLGDADLPLPLARALFVIAAFASEAGRTDVYNAAAALGYPTRWPDAASPADLVAHLLAAAATDAAVAELLDAAQILRDRSFRPRTTQLYVGGPGVDPVVGEPTQYVDRWCAEVGAWARSRDFGDVVSVTARAVAGVLQYDVVHEDRRSTVLFAAPRGAKKARSFASASQRPLRSHAVSYEPATRRLWITTDCLEAMTPLAAIAGRVLFDQPRHFLDAQAVDLWKLQEHGAAALHVPELAGKLTLSAIGGTWHSGKSHAMTPRGRDFFKALARYKIRIEGGRLDLMTLRARVASSAGGPAQCDVAVRPPHLLTVSEPELAPLLVQALDYAKIADPEPRVADFFSLQPWIDGATGWIASEGREGFAQLVADGILKPDPANRAVTPPEHPHAGRTATAYPLRGTRYLAWSPDPTVAPFVVEEEDLVVYALQFAKLAASIAAALGLEKPATKLDDDGVLYCGRRALGPTYVLLFLLTRPIRPATVQRLSEAAGHGHAVLVTPEGRMQPGGLRQIPMPKLAGPWQPLLAAIVRALDLESLVDTTLYAPLDARVVLHRATQRVWIDGVPCVALTEVHFRLLEILITHAEQLVHTKDIAEHVARGKQTEDTTRRAVDSFVAAVERSFTLAKREAPGDLKGFVTQPRHGRYRLGVKGFVE